MKTLELFNAVVKKDTKVNAFISEDGYIIESGALWAKDRILKYYEDNKLNGNDLNKTFHKSWLMIKNTDRHELFIEQIKHYISTYGSDFKDEVYIPDELLDISGLKLSFKVVKAYTKDELVKKCLSLLQSGIALKEETINEILSILVDELNYTFTGSENIRNKEAIVKIADVYGVLPTDNMEFFRYIIYRATGESLLIKNDEMVALIKESNYNPSIQFNVFGLEKLSEIFNRFKPLFLAFKPKCSTTINKISKLSKKFHIPIVSNPLNEVTSKLLGDEDKHWLDNATPFALFKALSACWTRMNGQDTFVYRVRNGKSFAKEYNLDDDKENKVIITLNYKYILNYIKENYDLKDKKIFLPKDIEYALPTSEKMFVGNVPTGTRFYGNSLAVGIYWENSWGACDLDLSGLNIGGKVGWNSDYKQGGSSLMFSGDITNAPVGAVEYLYANKGLKEPTLVMNNVYDGNHDAGFKIIIGKGDNIKKNYMMNPEKLFVDIKTKSVQKQSVLGIFLPVDDKKQSFVVLNFGSGNAHVSGSGKNSDMMTKGLFQQWHNAITLNSLLSNLDVEFVDNAEDAEFDFSLDNIEKDSFISLFKK